MHRHVAPLLTALLLVACGSDPSSGGGGAFTPCAAGCPAGQACNVAADVCEPVVSCASGCPAGKRCDTPSGLCVSKSCTLDSTCGVGQFCIGGLCTGCATGAVQCLSGLPVCRGPQDACGQCGADADCPPEAPVCDGGVCAQCSASRACPAGWGSCTWDFRCATNECDDLRPCAAGSACSPDGRCRPSCTLDASCSPAAPHCAAVAWDVGKRCVACLDDSECSGGKRCAGGDCAVPLPGDACDAPLPITLSGGEGWFVTDLDGYRTECPWSSCGVADAFLALTIETESTVDLVATAVGTFPSVDLQILSGCGHVVAGSNSTTIGSASIAGRILQPGIWLVRLAGDPYSTSALSLHVKLTPLPTGPGESCSVPRALVPNAAGTFSDWDTLVGHAQPSPDSCDNMAKGYPETIYTLDLASPSIVHLKVDPSPSNLGLGFAVKADCSSTATEGPNYCTIQYGWPQEATFNPLPAGRHYVVVTSQGTPGAYTLSGTALPIPPNDLCANAAPLSFDGTGAASASGQTRGAGYETGTCSACPSTATCYQAKDVYYSFSTVGQGDRALDVTVTPSGSATWAGRLVLSQTCAVPSTDVACGTGSAGGAATLSVGVLPEGNYILQVGRDGLLSEPGVDFSLAATLGPPRYPKPANDACFPPAEATFTVTGGSAFVTMNGDTRGADDSLGGTCAGAGGPDTVYAVQLPKVAYMPAYGGLVEVKVHPLTATFDPAVVFDDACATVGGACGNAAGPGQDELAQALIPNLGYFWVEGAGATAGQYTVGVRMIAQTPPSDLCSGAFSLGIDGSPIVGSLLATTPDEPCNGVAGPSGWFTLYAWDARATRTITLTPSGFDGAIAIYPIYVNGAPSTCGAACTQLIDAAGVDGVETYTVTLARSEILTFQIIGKNGGRGTYDLRAVP